jgi:hypothetical protein
MEKYMNEYSHHHADFSTYSHRVVTIKILRKELGMVEHTCNPCTWELRQEDLEFEASLDYTASLRLAWTRETLPQTKKKKKEKKKKKFSERLHNHLRCAESDFVYILAQWPLSRQPGGQEYAFD